jgi:hypothetical protein
VITTPNMGLTAWDQAGDPYDHTQLAANFEVIDNHDHSTGLGVKIGTAGIQNAAITQALLANNSVGSSQIIDGTIQAADLSSGLLTSIVPLGVVVPWWRPSVAVAAPAGFVIPTGQTITTGNHGFDLGSGVGVGSILLPDLRNQFLMGATDVTAIGTTGGSNAKDLRHTHPGGSHTHTIPGHSHTVNSHAHGVSDHSHSIANDIIKWSDDSGNPESLAVRSIFCNNGSLTVSSTPAGLEFAFIPNQIHTSGQGSEVVDTRNHNHGGGTGNSSGVVTDSQSPGTNSVGLTTDPGSANTGNPNTDFSALDLRPAWTGLLYIMRIKY